MSKIIPYQLNQTLEIQDALQRAEQSRFYHWTRSKIVQVDGRIYEVVLNIFERIYHCFLSLVGSDYLSFVFKGKSVEQLGKESITKLMARIHPPIDAPCRAASDENADAVTESETALEPSMHIQSPFLRQLPSELVLQVIKNLSGHDLLRLTEVNQHARAFVKALLQTGIYWNWPSFKDEKKFDKAQIKEAISLFKSLGKRPTIVQFPKSASPLSWWILRRLDLISQEIDSKPQTTAKLAAEFGDVYLCREALKSAPLIDKSVCMDIAILHEHPGIVELLIDLNVSASLDLFCRLISLRHIALARRLAAHHPDLLKEISPLQSATFRGKIEEFVEIEIKENEWEGLHDLPGPLHLAAILGDSVAIRELHRLGCPLDAVDSDSGQTALHYAAEYGQVEAILALYNLGCSMDAEELSFGHTALHYAAEFGQVKAILLLKALGCSVSAIDNDGLTALHYAAENGQTEAIQELAHLGCPDVTDSVGLTALQSATLRGHKDAARVLENLGYQ